MKSLFSVVAVFGALACNAQDYIITQKGDTLRGDVRIMSYDLMDRVQISAGKKKTVVTAIQTRGANVKGEVYVPIKFDNQIRMMKVIRSGFLSLYAFRLPNQLVYDGRLLVKPGSPPQEVPNLGFKRFIAALVDDCPQVGDRVRTGDLDRGNIEELVEDYNACVTKVREQRLAAAEFAAGNPTTELIDQLKTRVSNSDLSNKTEVVDLLNNISNRVRTKEAVPGYMKEGLKSYLSQRSDFKDDVDKLLGMLNQ